MGRGEAGFTDNSILGISGEKSTSGSHSVEAVPDQSPKCPQCKNQRVWKDGLRYTSRNDEPVQRWLCRDCGYRFSVSEASERVQTINRHILNYPVAYSSNRQVCELAEDSKNLEEETTRQEAAQRESTSKTATDQATTKGLIVQYMAWLEKEGYKTNGYLIFIKVLAKRGADLLDPESVKTTIAKQPWKDSSKGLAVKAYTAFTKMLGITWTRPKYTEEEQLPWIPEEAELDALIASCRSKRMAAYLQTLKETFADPGEALRLRWIDIDEKTNTITINKPVKGHKSRQLQVSSRLIAMLNTLPKTSERVFPTTYQNMHVCYVAVRARAAQRLQNPRLRNVSLTTFRHWGATMMYHYTKKLLLVKELLGHKRIENTMKYTRMVQFKDDEFDVETALTVDEAKALLSWLRLHNREKRHHALQET